MSKHLVWAVLAASLLVPLVGSAGVIATIPVTIYHSPADDGSSPTVLDLVPGTNTVNLWFDPTAALGGGVFGLSDVLIEASGGVQVIDQAPADPFSGGLACEGLGCLEGILLGAPPSAVSFSTGDFIGGDFAPTEIGTVLLDWDGITPGQFSVTTALTFDTQFNGGEIEPLPQLIARASPRDAPVPEPGAAVLFVAGATLVARSIRRSHARS